jgi:hypothetical protein
MTANNVNGIEIMRGSWNRISKVSKKAENIIVTRRIAMVMESLS